MSEIKDVNEKAIDDLDEEDKNRLYDELGRNKKVLMVKKDEFVRWYFDEIVNNSIIEQLIDKGTVNLLDVLNDAGYIPISLVENKENIDKEDIGEDEDDIEEPSRKYRLEFIKQN